jgi:hypothetical protein
MISTRCLGENDFKKWECTVSKVQGEFHYSSEDRDKIIELLRLYDESRTEYSDCMIEGCFYVFGGYKRANYTPDRQFAYVV